MKGSLYPLLFIVGDDPKTEKFVVKISKFDEAVYDSRWMDDPTLGDYCRVPDVDITEEVKTFQTMLEAQRFIQAWWARQDLI